jgi:hypothetical protein
MNALEPQHLHVVERFALMFAAALIAVAFVLAPRGMAFAITVGAGLMTLNAWAIRRIAERAFKSAGGRVRPGFAVLLFNVKMLVLIGMVIVAVRVLHLDAIGFLIGISVFPVAIFAAALKLNLGRGEAADGDGPDGEIPAPGAKGDR